MLCTMFYHAYGDSADVGESLQPQLPPPHYIPGSSPLEPGRLPLSPGRLLLPPPVLPPAGGLAGCLATHLAHPTSQPLAEGDHIG